MKIHYLGPEGTFSYLAAKNFLKDLAEPNGRFGDLLGHLRVEDVFEAMDNDWDFGVIAAESNIEGVVTRNIDLLIERTDLKVAAQVAVNVSFDVVGKKNILQNQSKVFAHQHALAQCRNFISENQLIENPVASNVAALENLEGKEIALVPSFATNKLCEKYNLEIIDKDVQDYKNAQTQFYILHKIHPDPQCLPINDINNTTILYFIPPRIGPGTLLEVLQIFNNHKLNMIELFSRPIKSVTNEYSFVTILEKGHLTIEVQSAINELRNLGAKVRIIGSYKR
ncbi:MAG: hypothetical protein LBM13_01565 [Candidatus Ancillula sp.]|nr:hypothetical protein [Candidatus Ancillula sp.]